jgi:hypothetical protein
MLLVRQIKLFAHKQMVCTCISLVIAVAPHLITVFSMMHVYAGLAMIAIIIAYTISHTDYLKPVTIAFILWMVSALSIDMHLIDASIDSGRIGKRMAKEAIEKTGQPVDNVYVIIIEDDYPKLSSFCVIPNEAFGWGMAAQYETNYQWPKAVKDTIIERTDDYINKVNHLVEKTKSEKQYEVVWIVNHDQVEVIK